MQYKESTITEYSKFQFVEQRSHTTFGRFYPHTYTFWSLFRMQKHHSSEWCFLFYPLHQKQGGFFFEEVLSSFSSNITRREKNSAKINKDGAKIERNVLRRRPFAHIINILEGMPWYEHAAIL